MRIDLDLPSTYVRAERALEGARALLNEARRSLAELRGLVRSLPERAHGNGAAAVAPEHGVKPLDLALEPGDEIEVERPSGHGLVRCRAKLLRWDGDHLVVVYWNPTSSMWNRYPARVRPQRVARRGE